MYRTREELGSGQFGTVYRGVWQQTSDSEDTDVEVAVKTMEEGASEEERIKFLQEAAIMGQFKNHPNIVTILGIVLDAPVSSARGHSMTKHAIMLIIIA